jgi:hypothetical protein
MSSNKHDQKIMKENPIIRHSVVLWSCAALLTAQLTATAQTLSHRYSFFSTTNGTTNVVDLVGTNNGTLGGDAQFVNGQLQLDGSAYVALQPGIVTNDLAVTVEAWGDFPPLSQQNTWGNLFDFGTKDASGSDSYSISFCVNTGGSDLLDAALSDFDTANVNRENCYSVLNPIAGTTGAYIAAVFNPPAGYIALYVNGVLNAQIAITETITPGVQDLNNWIGWDNWPDPNMVGNLDEFRVWNGALNGLEVAASAANGFANLNTNAGAITGVQLSAGPQVVQGGQEPSMVLATASLITNVVDVTAFATYSSGNTNIITVGPTGVIHGIGIGSTSVTASYGGQSSSITVTVVEPISVLAHRYSFNDPTNSSAVADSVGTLTGNLMGTAYETNGQVVLDGSTLCYVDLGSNAFTNNGVISGYQSATVDYWATFTTLQNWNYAWAFGNSAGYGFNYIHSVVRDGNTQHEIDNYTSAGGSGFAALGDFANETVHCTTVIDPPTGHLAIYTNGILSGFVTNDFAPLATIATNYCYIGRSLWTSLTTGVGDPYWAGSIDEIRVYNGVVTPQQIALADALGPNDTNIVVGALQSIQVSIPTLNLGDAFVGGAWATYANLTNYNLVANSLTPLLIYTSSNSNVVYQTSNGSLLAAGLGSATVTATYKGFTSSQLVTVVHAPVLVNRYSFQDAPGSATAADSVGGSNWDGVLPNGGTFSGTNLQLSGASVQYVQLPSGILSNYPAVTIDMWCTFPTQMPVNCQLYAFGNTDSGGAGYNYIFCAPQGGRIAISGVDPGYDGEEGCGGAGDLSFQNNIHLTSVYDPPAGKEYWYTNGVLVSRNTGITIPMYWVDQQDVLNYICHSLYTGDPHEDLNISEFRIYNGALSPAEVEASQVLGPSIVLSNGATQLTATVSNGQLVISWPLTAAGFSLYSSGTLGPKATWTLVSETPAIVGQTYQVSIPTSGAAQFYELRR